MKKLKRLIFACIFMALIGGVVRLPGLDTVISAKAVIFAEPERTKKFYTGDTMRASGYYFYDDKYKETILATDDVRVGSNGYEKSMWDGIRCAGNFGNSYLYVQIPNDRYYFEEPNGFQILSGDGTENNPFHLKYLYEQNVFKNTNLISFDENTKILTLKGTVLKAYVSPYAKSGATKVVADKGAYLSSDCSEMFMATDGNWKDLLSVDLSLADASGVRDARAMFKGSERKLSSVILTSFGANLENAIEMFDGCSNLTRIVVSEKWEPLNIWYGTDMFYNCKSLVGGNGTRYSSLYTGPEYARIDKAGEPGYLTYAPYQLDDVAIGTTWHLGDIVNTNAYFKTFVEEAGHNHYCYFEKTVQFKRGASVTGEFDFAESYRVDVEGMARESNKVGINHIESEDAHINGIRVVSGSGTVADPFCLEYVYDKEYEITPIEIGEEFCIGDTIKIKGFISDQDWYDDPYYGELGPYTGEYRSIDTTMEVTFTGAKTYYSQQRNYYTTSILPEIKNMSLSDPKPMGVRLVGGNGTSADPYRFEKILTSTSRKQVIFYNDGKMDETMGSVVLGKNEDQYILPECTYEDPEGMGFAGWQVGNQTYQANDEITLTDSITIVDATWVDHVHEYGKPSYVWADDNSFVIASKVCKADANHRIQEKVNTSYVVESDSSCTKKGIGKYTANFTKEGFETQTKKVDLPLKAHTLSYKAEVPAKCTESGMKAHWKCSVCKKFFADSKGKKQVTEKELIIPATSHDWAQPTYTWADDNGSVAALRICKNDGNHKEAENVSTTYEVLEAPTEQATGKGLYTATFKNSGFTTQTKEVVIPKLEHKHSGTNVTAHKAQAATCTNAGNTAYYSCTCGKYFSDKACTKEIKKNSWVIKAKGHAYGEATYTWSSDNKTVTATMVCANDAKHKITETVDTTYKVTKKATEQADGKGRYTATFTKEGFTTQTKDVKIAKLSHKHSGSNVTAHAAVAATCTTAGNSAYYSCTCGKYFSDKACTKEIKKNSWVIKAKGHNYGKATYKWSSDNKTVTATKICKNDSSHKVTEKVKTTYEVIKDATTEATGTGRYTATFTKDGFAVQTKNVTIPKKTKENSEENPKENPEENPKDNPENPEQNPENPEENPKENPEENPENPDSKSVTEIFNDVPEGAWYVGAVQFAYDHKIMNGTSDKTFSPLVTLNRAQFVTVLYNYENRPTIKYDPKKFTDVKASDYFAFPVMWAAKNEITSGIASNLFGPNQNISREQMAVMLYKFAQYKKIKVTLKAGALDNFYDKEQISNWATEALNWAVSNGIINGKGTYKNTSKEILDPKGTATRAECAQVIKNFMEKVEK